MLIIWGLSVIYRTLGRGVFFCRRCGGDRGYRHRTGRRFVTVFFIPLIPLMKTGEHVQCLTCKTRYVTEVLKLPTTVQMQVSLVAGMRAMVAIILRAGDPANPLARRRAIDAVTGTGESEYDEDALTEDLAEPIDTARPKVSALGAQLQIEAREWWLAEAVRIAMADGPLTGAERAAAEHLAAALGMTQAQAIGVIALTEQNIVLSRGLWSPPAPNQPSAQLGRQERAQTRTRLAGPGPRCPTRRVPGPGPRCPTCRVAGSGPHCPTRRVPGPGPDRAPRVSAPHLR
jgi:hypothetical protein